MDDHVGASERALHDASSMSSAIAWRLAHAGVERHGHDEVDEVAPAGVAHAHAAQLHRLVEPGERRADALLGLELRCGP